MTKLQAERGPSSSDRTTSYDAKAIDAALKALRTLWEAIEHVPEVNQTKLKKDILKSVGRLKTQIESQLLKYSDSNRIERLLFPIIDGKQISAAPELFTVQSADRFPEPSLRVYNKDLAEHALQHLPHTSQFSSKEQLRQHLTKTIRFNSLATRRRSANYLINRFFPGEEIHADLPKFAGATAGKPALGEALFYLTCRSELIVAMVAEDVVYPSLAQRGVARSRMLEYVQSKFTGSKSADEITQAIVRTYERFGIGTSNRTMLNISLREGSVEAFAYILHLEFPEPGMYSFGSILSGPMHKWLLWDREWMVKQLYRLRESGLLSKVSEIDRMRQFTTKFSLSDAIDPIVALVKEPAP